MKNILKLVIFDISGTLIDQGSLVTVKTFQKTFKKYKLNINPELIIKDMGIDKNTHIKKILDIPEINVQFGKYKIKKKNICIKICKEFDKILKQEVRKKFDYIEGFAELINFLIKKKIKIALTTGYPRNILNYILKRFSKKKFYPDFAVSVSDVKRGRPHKDMIVKILENLKIECKNAFKVDDSFAGILEGKNARVKTIGLTLTGINFPKTRLQKKKFSKKKLNSIHYKISKKFKKINTNFILRDLEEVRGMFEKLFDTSN